MSSSRPVLDGPTKVIYVQLSVVGLFIVGFGPIQALLRDDQGSSRTVSGLHATALAVAGIVAALVVPRLVSRLGRSRVITLAVVTFSLGAVFLTIPASAAWTIPSVGLASLATATMLIGFTAFLLDHQGKAGPASLTQANALAAAAGTLGPLLVGFSAAFLFGWRTAVWLIVALLVTCEVVRLRYRSTFTTNSRVKDVPVPWRALPRAVWFSVVMVAIFNSVELTTIIWSADLLVSRAGVSLTMATAVVSAVPAGIVVGRVLGARLAEVRSIDGLLGVGFLVALAGFAIVWFTSTLIPMAVGLFVVGLGISLNWPLGVSRVVLASGGRSTQATSLASLAGGVAIATVPISLGFLADRLSIHAAFLLLPVLLGVAASILVLGPRPSFEQRGSNVEG